MIESIVSYINTLTAGNQFAAGGIITVLSGSLMMVLRSTPVALFGFLKKQLTTTLTFNNTDWEKNKTFIGLNTFIKSKTTDTGSRTVSVDTYWDEDERKTKIILNIGYGIHFFFYKRKLMWVNKSRLESSGSEKQKEETSISCFSRSHDIFKSLIKDNEKEKDSNKLTISEWKSDEWQIHSEQTKRGMDYLALNSKIKDTFKNEIDYFIENKDTYMRLGLNHKSTFLLYGEPGTGKTSIIKAIASDYDMNICVLNINGHNDQSFSEAMNAVPKNSIILIEDFDSSASVTKRAIRDNDDDEKDELTKMMTSLSLTGILNTLDGVCSLDGCLVFMTTNVLDKIDPAVYRSGRVDCLIELPPIDKTTVAEYFVKLYGNVFDSNIDWKDTKACNINDIIFNAKDDSTRCNDLIIQAFGKNDDSN